MATRSLGQRWRSVALPMAALRLSGQAIEFAGWVVFARRLGTSAFGDLAVAFLVARYAGVVADWGAFTRGARDVAAAGRHGSIARFVRKRRTTGIVLSIAGVIAAVAFQRPGLAPVALVVLSFGLSRDWIAVGRERGARAGIPGALQGVVILGVSLWASTTTQAAIAVGAGYGVAALVSMLLNPVGDEIDHDAEEVGAAHGWVLAAMLANQITSSTDTVLLKLLQSSSFAGIYAAVYRIPNAWLAVLTLMLGSLLPMATSSHFDDPRSHAELRRRSLRVSAIGAAAILLLTPASWAVSPVLFGSAYESGREPLVILMLATAVITLAAPLHPFAISMGRDRSYALILVGGAAANITANFAVIPWLGMNGAALTTLGAQVIVSALLWRLVRRPSAGIEVSGLRDPRRSAPSGQ